MCHSAIECGRATVPGVCACIVPRLRVCHSARIVRVPKCQVCGCAKAPLRAGVPQCQDWLCARVRVCHGVTVPGVRVRHSARRAGVPQCTPAR